MVVESIKKRIHRKRETEKEQNVRKNTLFVLVPFQSLQSSSSLLLSLWSFSFFFLLTIFFSFSFFHYFPSFLVVSFFFSPTPISLSPHKDDVSTSVTCITVWNGSFVMRGREGNQRRERKRKRMGEGERKRMGERK